MIDLAALLNRLQPWKPDVFHTASTHVEWDRLDVPAAEQHLWDASEALSNWLAQHDHYSRNSLVIGLAPCIRRLVNRQMQRKRIAPERFPTLGPELFGVGLEAAVSSFYLTKKNAREDEFVRDSNGNPIPAPIEIDYDTDYQIIDGEVCHSGNEIDDLWRHVRQHVGNAIAQALYRPQAGGKPIKQKSLNRSHDAETTRRPSDEKPLGRRANGPHHDLAGYLAEHGADDALKGAIQALSTTDFAILDARMRGESYSTTGERLGMSADAVRRRADRLFRTLQKTLK